MIQEIAAKTLLAHHKEADHYFGIKYGMNLYRGCQHRCIYCDSRSECYQIEDFDGQVLVKADDQVALEAVAAHWRVEYNAPSITVKDVICDGCVVEGRHCAHWGECDIRACGQEHDVANCAHCSEYDECAKLERLFGFVPAAKATLDGIRGTLI